MNARSFHLSVQGASHIRKNKECQDASASYQDESCVIAVVCDGHGGDDYVRSAVGSKIGCEVAENDIKSFIHSVDKESFFSNPDRHLKNLEASIINGWNESISAYHAMNPFQENELGLISEKARKRYVDEGKIESAYGTTMIAVAMNHDYWFGIHIGDGKCVAINAKGEFKQPIPWDPKCFLNATTSICDSDAIERFRHFYSDKLPAAVFVGSDGVDDCFSNNEQLHNLYKTVLYSFATSEFQEACEGLADYLPRLSAKGSGDDVSVAALLDLDLIPEISIVKEFDREKEKARVEENARKEAEKNEAERRRVEEEHARFQERNNAKAKRDQLVSPPKFCGNCGKRVVPGAKFCSNCGAPIIYVTKLHRPAYNTDEVELVKSTQLENKSDVEELAPQQEEKCQVLPEMNNVADGFEETPEQVIEETVVDDAEQMSSAEASSDMGQTSERVAYNSNIEEINSEGIGCIDDSKPDSEGLDMSVSEVMEEGNTVDSAVDEGILADIRDACEADDHTEEVDKMTFGQETNI